MSTSLLYHGFGVRGYQYVSTDYVGGEIWFGIEQPREGLRCPLCDSPEVSRRGEAWRTFRTLPIGSKRVTLTLPVARVECAVCDVVRQVAIPFADSRRTYTKSFARYALELSRHMTIQDVAEHLGVGWDLIKDLQKTDLQRRFKKIPLKKLRQLAIDEISIGKQSRYLTVVLDLKSGAVVFVGEGKGSQALEPFWKRLRCARAKIQAVAMDMSPAYIKAVSEHLPQAQIVFDHFHIIKLFNEKLSDLRRELFREAHDDQKLKDVLKGTRWLLLKNPEHLDPQQDEPKRLDKALKLNAPLATAYYLKEELRQLWQQPNWRAGRKFLTSWCARATASGIGILQQFARTLRKHARGILNYFKFPISTGPLEGTNNKIRTMQRQAYGFRDHQFFKLKIYALHETRFELVG
jgi:transposase